MLRSQLLRRVVRADGAPHCKAKENALDAQELQSQIDRVPFWYHAIELPGGITTPGISPGPLKDFYDLPKDMTGKRVLDVGAFDGYWTFECLRRGADSVLAIDDGSDLLKAENMAGMEIRVEDRSETVVPWEGFDLCKHALGYNDQQCERKTLSLYDVSPDTVGQFDVVLLFGVLYHLRWPMYGLDRAASVCCSEMYLESACVDYFSPYDGLHPLVDMPRMEFYAGKQYGGNPTNWWVPTSRCITEMLVACDFKPISRCTLNPAEQPDMKIKQLLGFSRCFITAKRRTQ